MNVINPHVASVTSPQPDPPLADRLVRDLVDVYPETLTVLGPLGIDLCCGGGHPLGEALDRHGIERERVVPRIARIIANAPHREA